MPQNGLQCLRHLLRWIDDVNLHSKWRSWSSPPPWWGFLEEFLPMISVVSCIPSSAGVCVHPASTWEGMEGKHHIHLCHYLLLSRVTRWDICPPNQSLWPIFSYDPSVNTLATLLLFGFAESEWIADGFKGFVKPTGIRFFSEVFWNKNTTVISTCQPFKDQ